MSYLNFHDIDFLLKVVDCYYKKSYLSPKGEEEKDSDDFLDHFYKVWGKTRK